MVRRLALISLRAGFTVSPTAMYFLAGLTGSLTAWARRGVSTESLRWVLPELSRREAHRARRASWRMTLRSQLLDAALLLDGCPHPYPRVVAGPDPASLDGPLVLVTFHIGTPAALGPFLERLPGEVYAIQISNWPDRPGLTMSRSAEGQTHRAADYWHAQRTLRRGGFAFLAIDGFGVPLDVHLLGLRYRLARGAFALARAANAPLMPLVARWRGSRIEVVAGDPALPGEDDDQELADSIMAWLGRFIRENPGEISRNLLAPLELFN